MSEEGKITYSDGLVWDYRLYTTVFDDLDESIITPREESYCELLDSERRDEQEIVELFKRAKCQ